MEKPFVIECKLGGDDRWETWARYHTERARQTALECLNGGKWEPIAEFRAKQ